MNLYDIIRRPMNPAPWSEGAKIPWNDPEFSRRMLREHLTQLYDAASRRLEKIDRHVEWIHSAVLAGRLGKILDLGCGPGLYANRLAEKGHDCFGIDFSPASIAYAREHAGVGLNRANFLEADVRTAEFGGGFGLAMFIFGEWNAFSRQDGKRILEKMHRSLAQGGKLLLEVSRLEIVKSRGIQPPNWFCAEEGLFSDRPYVGLQEAIWSEAGCATMERYYIIDALSGNVETMMSTTQAYSDEEYKKIVEESGFVDVEFFPSLMGVEDPAMPEFFVLTAEKE